MCLEDGKRFKSLKRHLRTQYNMTPEQYTDRYDAIVTAIKAVVPAMKFVGLSLAYPSGNPRMFEYFIIQRIIVQASRWT